MADDLLANVLNAVKNAGTGIMAGQKLARELKAMEAEATLKNSLMQAQTRQYGLESDKTQAETGKIEQETKNLASKPEEDKKKQQEKDDKWNKMYALKVDSAKLDKEKFELSKKVSVAKLDEKQREEINQYNTQIDNLDNELKRLEKEKEDIKYDPNVPAGHIDTLTRNIGDTLAQKRLYMEKVNSILGMKTKPVSKLKEVIETQTATKKGGLGPKEVGATETKPKKNKLKYVNGKLIEVE